jgi:hypothetical protein
METEFEAISELLASVKTPNRRCSEPLAAPDSSFR